MSASTVTWRPAMTLALASNSASRHNHAGVYSRPSTGVLALSSFYGRLSSMRPGGAFLDSYQCSTTKSALNSHMING